MTINSRRDQQYGNTTFLFVGIALLAIMIGFFVQTGMSRPQPLPEFNKMIVFPTAKNITPITFTDHHGQDFGLQQLQNKWSILFFGFTNCPDICPTTMQTLKQVKQSLQEKSLWGNYQVVMISVDPETDTPERLANYVPFFDPEFIGISSSVEKTTAFAKQLGILFIKRDNDENGRYDVDHSASLILINPQGQWAGVIGAPHKADAISLDLATLAEHTGPIKQRPKQSSIQPKAKSTSSTEAKQNSPLSINDLVIKQAWVRPAPSTASSMAAYFELTNNTNKDIEIVNSTSPAFDMTMIHNTVIEQGLAKMQHMNSLVIPANSTVVLEPLGKHMMLMRPENVLKLGDSVQITLIDGNGKHYQYDIEVRQPEQN